MANMSVLHTGAAHIQTTHNHTLNTYHGHKNRERGTEPETYKEALEAAFIVTVKVIILSPIIIFFIRF